MIIKQKTEVKLCFDLRLLSLFRFLDFFVPLPQQHGCSLVSVWSFFFFVLKLFDVCVNSWSKQLTCKVTSHCIDTRTDTIENCIRRQAVGICSKYITEHKCIADTACLAVCKGNGSIDF